MKKYEILKDFFGSQDGSQSEQFLKGNVSHLSDDLGSVAVKEGWAKLFVEKTPTRPKQVTKKRVAKKG